MNFKKILAALLSTIILTLVSAESSLAGFIGTSVTINPGQDAVPEVSVQEDIAGQYTLIDSLSFRGNFQFTSDDVVSYGLFTDTPSVFSIQELSGTFTFFTGKSLLKITALLGNLSPFGSDSFVKQSFGVREFSSELLSPRTTPSSTGINVFSGMGFSITDVFGQNALGFYGFYDRNNQNESPQINADIDYAFETGSIILESAIGMSVPADSLTATERDISSIIEETVFRTGISTLFRISGRMKLFLQAGISGTTISHLPEIALNDVFLFAEPRFLLPGFNMNIAFFCLSDTGLRNLPFITKPLGCSISLESLPFSLFRHTASAAIDVTACSVRKPASVDGIDIVVAPQVNCSLFSGDFKAAAEFHPLERSDISKAFKIALSYKAQF